MRFNSAPFLEHQAPSVPSRSRFNAKETRLQPLPQQWINILLRLKNHSSHMNDRLSIRYQLFLIVWYVLMSIAVFYSYRALTEVSNGNHPLYWIMVSISALSIFIYTRDCTQRRIDQYSEIESKCGEYDSLCEDAHHHYCDESKQCTYEETNDKVNSLSDLTMIYWVLVILGLWIPYRIRDNHKKGKLLWTILYWCYIAYGGFYFIIIAEQTGYHIANREIIQTLDDATLTAMYAVVYYKFMKHIFSEAESDPFYQLLNCSHDSPQLIKYIQYICKRYMSPLIIFAYIACLGALFIDLPSKTWHNFTVFKNVTRALALLQPLTGMTVVVGHFFISGFVFFICSILWVLCFAIIFKLDRLSYGCAYGVISAQQLCRDLLSIKSRLEKIDNCFGAIFLCQLISGALTFLISIGFIAIKAADSRYDFGLIITSTIVLIQLLISMHFGVLIESASNRLESVVQLQQFHQLNVETHILFATVQNTPVILRLGGVQINWLLYVTSLFSFGLDIVIYAYANADIIQDFMS